MTTRPFSPYDTPLMRLSTVLAALDARYGTVDPMTPEQAATQADLTVMRDALAVLMREPPAPERCPDADDA